jgi:hypothetical protein
MACCNDKFAKNFDYVRRLAVALCLLEKYDVQIHKFRKAGVGDVYAFEQFGKDRGAGLIEVLRYEDLRVRDDQSETVLQDNGQLGTGVVEEKPIVKRGRKPVVPVVDEPDGGILPGS